MEQGADDRGGVATEQTLADAQRVILRTLQVAGTDVYRTKLVKLVYFIDYIHHQHEGRTRTGFRYMWDNYGPNAISNRIVAEADLLAEEGLVRIKPQTSPYGEMTYLYRADPEAFPLELDSLAEVIISDVVTKYRDYGVQEIADASKATPPFANAQPGDVLEFSPPKFNPNKRRGVIGDPSTRKSLAEISADFGLE